MDFHYREEDGAVAALARQILEDHATREGLVRHEASGAAWDETLWAALASSDLLGTAIPEEYGGSGLDFLALCLLVQETGRTVAPVPLFPALVLGALPLSRFGTAAQKESWLPAIARGTRIVTAALAEYGSSDPEAPQTRAVAVADGFRLRGLKTNVPVAGQASHVLVPARLEDGSIGLFFVEPDGDGVTVTAQETSDGQAHGQIELVDAPVGLDDRLAADVDGGVALRWITERAVVARCMMQLGVTERALEMTAAYTRERVQFDRPIGSFQAVHQRAADAYIQVEAIRLSAQEAAWRLAQELPSAEHVAVAKYWAAEGGQFAAYACQHLHGGIGIDMDYTLHRYFTWAIQGEHELGSARHHLERLGARIAAGELLGTAPGGEAV